MAAPVDVGDLSKVPCYERLGVPGLFCLVEVVSVQSAVVGAGYYAFVVALAEEALEEGVLAAVHLPYSALGDPEVLLDVFLPNDEGEVERRGEDDHVIFWVHLVATEGAALFQPELHRGDDRLVGDQDTFKGDFEAPLASLEPVAVLILEAVFALGEETLVQLLQSVQPDVLVLA